MDGVTLLIAIVLTLIALSRRQSGAALGIVVFSMLIWPEYLRVPFGIAEMSAPRLVAIAVLIKYFRPERLRPIHLADKFILWLWLFTIVAPIIQGAEFSYVSQMIGRGLDTVLMYFCARVAIRTPDDIRALCGPIIMTAVIFGLLGVIEATSSFNIYWPLYSYRDYTWVYKGLSYRLGFLRAQASTSVSIYFGMAMMLIAGMIWSIRGYAVRAMILKVSLLLSFLGALSSLSSGPWIACAILIAFVFYERRTHFIKPTLYVLLIALIVMEIASNRHFYHLIDYLSLDPHNAWYRTKLLEVAAYYWRDFWLFGVGDQIPHYWAEKLDGRAHLDVVNHFLMVALYGGFPALVMYVCSHVAVLRTAIKVWTSLQSQQIKALIFGLAATLVALDISSMSVSLFGPPLLLSNILLGMLLSISLGAGNNHLQQSI